MLWPLCEQRQGTQGPHAHPEALRAPLERRAALLTNPSRDPGFVPVTGINQLQHLAWFPTPYKFKIKVNYSDGTSKSLSREH